MQLATEDNGSSSLEEEQYVFYDVLILPFHRMYPRFSRTASSMPYTTLLHLTPKEYPNQISPSSQVYIPSHHPQWYPLLRQYLLNRHLLPISLSSLNLLTRLLDGLEDGFVREGFGGFDLGGLFLEGDVEGFNSCLHTISISILHSIMEQNAR